MEENHLKQETQKNIMEHLGLKLQFTSQKYFWRTGTSNSSSNGGGEVLKAGRPSNAENYNGRYSWTTQTNSLSTGVRSNRSFWNNAG